MRDLDPERRGVGHRSELAIETYLGYHTADADDCGICVQQCLRTCSVPARCGKDGGEG